MKKMRFPCEDLVKYVIPAIRAIIVKELNQKYEKNQIEIANLLSITQPSVSYYLRGERGELGAKIIEKISSSYQKILDLTERIVQGTAGEMDLLKFFCNICSELRPHFMEAGIIQPDEMTGSHDGARISLI